MWRMMRLKTSLLLIAAVLLVGCSSKTANLVGMWKARPNKTVSSPNLRDVQNSAMMSLVTQNLTLEFNKDGAFKMSQPMGWGTGTYKWEGEDLVLTFNTFAPQQPLHLRFGEGGKTLESVTEFQSDVKLVLEKAP